MAVSFNCPWVLPLCPAKERSVRGVKRRRTGAGKGAPFLSSLSFPPSSPLHPPCSCPLCTPHDPHPLRREWERITSVRHDSALVGTRKHTGPIATDSRHGDDQCASAHPCGAVNWIVLRSAPRIYSPRFVLTHEILTYIQWTLPIYMYI